MLTILHLSDLHWCPDNSQDLMIVVDALIADLDRLKIENGLQPDVIIFSGDLAMGGDRLDWLQGGYDSLLLPVAAQTGLTMDRIFVSPGNHDIAREEVRKIPSIEATLKANLSSTAEINKFLDAERVSGGEKDLALHRMDNFYEAHDSYHSGSISHSPFLRTFKIDIESRKIGVACFNSAWRATGESDDVDFRKLMIGERVIDQALLELRDCEFKIAVQHHPIDWLTPADAQTTDFLTRKFFNLLCCGHTHSARPIMSRDATGICITSQTGSVFEKREWFNGYQIIEVDIPSQTFTFTVREYINHHRRFAPANNVCDGGHVTLQGMSQGDPKRADQVELILRGAREHLRTTVLDHLSMVGEEGVVYTVSDLITPPLVTRNRESLEKNEGDDASGQGTIYKVCDLVASDDNLVVVGSRQSGKTGIAHMLAYDLAYGANDKVTIPLYVDLRGYKFNRYAIKRAILASYGAIPAGFNLDRALDEGLFTIIADNLASTEGDIEKLSKHINDFSENRWIVFTTPDSDAISPTRIISEKLPNFRRFYIQELTRGGIRALSKRWYTDDKQAKAAYEMVINQIVRDGLPRTPYMVSLLLWAIQQKRDLTKINEAMLLANIMDHLLGKADFRQAKRGVLNPIGMEITLQNLAKHLKEHDGVMPENDVTSFLIQFFERKRLNFIGGDVLDKLVMCGVLARDGDSISFKHACFQDYFFAQLLNSDRKLLGHYIGGLDFLEVRRELELLAGIRQQNDDIIDAIMAVLDSRVPERFRHCDIEAFSRISNTELKVGTTLAQLGKIRRTRLTDDQVDEIMDEADRRALARGDRPVSESLENAEGDVIQAAKDRETEGIKADKAAGSEPIRPSTHMAAIDTLARVIRNSDFTDYDAKGPATRRVIESWTKIFLLVMEEMSEILKAAGEKSGEPLTEEEASAIYYIMSKFMFNGIGSGLIEHLSSPSMADTLHSLIEDSNLSSGEYLLTLFLLEDSDDRRWREMWSEVIRDTTSSGFVIDCFVQRLMMIAHTKALDDDQVKRVRIVVGEIEKRLEWSNNEKSGRLQGMQDAVTMNAVKQARY